MAQKARAENLQRRLDAVAELEADSAAFLNPLLVPAFEQAFVRIAAVLGQA
jgi:hypothetical protein